MLLIYLPKISARCNYIFDYIFQTEFGIEYDVTTDITEFQRYQQEKINYSFSRIDNALFVKASSLLFENKITKQEIIVEEKKGMKVLFPNSNDDLGFDIFSAAFFLISRYEEYLPFTPDEFGRFNAEESLAFKNGFSDVPIVNIWVKIFQIELLKKFPNLEIRRTSFQAILTYDIDVAYKYLGRSFGRNIGSLLKDVFSFNLKNIHERIQTIFNAEKDPWDVYDELKSTIVKNQLASNFFFLLSNKTKYDRNLNYKNNAMKRLVDKITSFSNIGIHPSFYSSVFPRKILIEKERLEDISGKKINRSRQHFLKFKLPGTYNALLSAGITEDYSMGFSKMPGFRAGTCKPFYFYDLKNEKETKLKIFPVTFMDGTLMNSNPNEALKKILQLLKEIKKVGGTFIPLWHNHTISETDEFAEWKNVHDKMIEQILFTLNAS
ncbi:MAG: polysaccharide deacetylase family protein [Ginsengibacter sp.]